MTKPEVVLFDLGNVLITIHPEAFSHSLGIGESERAAYRDGVIAAVRLYEGGLITSDDYFSRLSELFGGRFSRDELTRAMLNVIGEPVAGMEKLVQDLAPATTLGLVSNTNELHFEHCRRSFPVISAFRHTFLSHKMKRLKPDPQYYDKVLAAFDVEPYRLLFIDDLPENIEGARNAGMQALQFTDDEALRYSLRALSLLDASG